MDADMRRLLIMRTDFSSSNQRLETKKIDDMREELTFRWSKDIRRKIGEVRNKFMNKLRKPALNFYGLLVIRERDRDELSKVAEEANTEMQKIDSELGAHIKFIPLYLEQEAKGEVYQQVLGSIQARIYGELFMRLKELAKLEEIPKQSRTALIKLCDRLHTWNVVDDPNVAKTLADIKLQFENDVFKPVLNDLQKEIDSLKERGAFIEFDEEPQAAPTTTTDG